MDIGKLLKNINSINEYSAVTQDASEKCKSSRIQLNMSTVLALKKIRSFEIEYVNKSEENGIAIVIFERMLCLPPSKTWGVLSKEVVNLLQYWLDAVRKHLVKHSPHWWTFLKLLLKFIKDIRQKDSSIPNILVEHTAECLLDLASNTRPDAMQRYEILHCFNMYCSESSREIRFALRNKLGPYFIKLSTYMCTCGSLPTQYSIMETLLRWLLPRQDHTLRIASATKWFPAKLYAENAVDIFLERPWINFFQDARDFLNTHNASSDLITTVIIRKLSVGDVVIKADTEKMDSWLDINSASNCLSVLLDPKVLEEFGSTNHKSFETFVVSDDNTHTAKLYRESQLLTLTIQTVSPPRVLPSCIKLADDVSCQVNIIVTSHCDVKKLDGALRKMFQDKYQLLLDLEKELPLSPPKVNERVNKNGTEEDARFSHPVEVRRRKHSGYIVKSRQPLSCLSPSTASTSSLAQLHDKLAALPRYKFEKEPQSVCALPELSIVSEVSETDDRSFATLKFKSYGVCYKNKNTLDANRKSQSDNEAGRRYPEISRQVKGRGLSPVIQEDPTSCLLVATIGSADDSVINETVERLSKSKDYNPDNIVDLLVQEALNSKSEKHKDKNDSGINTGEKRSQDVNENIDIVDNTPNADVEFNKRNKIGPKVVSSTSDESNTEAINDTPNVYVNTRRRKKDIHKDNVIEKNSFDVQVVEEFFSQHFAESKTGQITISPSLAKKINETSSEGDDHLDDNFILMGDDLHEVEPYDFSNIDVLECLNSIVDRVCDDFDKCTKYLNEGHEPIAKDNNSDEEDDLPLRDIKNTIQNLNTSNTRIAKKPTNPKSINLRYKPAPKKNTIKSRKMKRKTRLELEIASKMSVIMEIDTIDEGSVAEAPLAECNVPPKNKENIVNANDDSVAADKIEAVTPVLRRKRKLFSPKDEQLGEKAPESPLMEENNFTDSKIKKTPKSTGTYEPYKDIEKERQRHIRMPRNRKSRKVQTPSPRSKKMNDLFNQVKQSANGEQVNLVNKGADFEVFNFSSDSEDDFKQKKIEVAKRKSNTLDENNSTVIRRGRRVKRINYSTTSSNKNSKIKETKRQRAKKKTDIESAYDLVDERMREAKVELNTSIVVQTPKVVITEPEFIIEKPFEMEAINEKEENEDQPKGKRTKKHKVKAAELVKRAKSVLKTRTYPLKDNDDRTESPLPGLVVEEAPTANKEDAELSANMVDKFKKICQNPEKYINESNTTQNLLSDNERLNYSPQNIDITEEFMEFETKNKKKTNPKSRDSKMKQSKRKISSEKKSIEAVNLDTNSEKSIATVGITGHGDSDEAPPSPKLIMEILEPRNLTIEYLDKTSQDYYQKLRDQINDNNEDCQNKSRTTNKMENNSKTSKCPEVAISNKSPVVSIEKISLEDISRWLPSRRNSDSDDNSDISIKSKPNSNGPGRKVKSSKSVKRNVASDSEEDTEIKEAIRRSLVNKKSTFRISHSRECTRDSNEGSIASSRLSTKSKRTARVQPSRNVKCTQSIISPIKLFDDLISNSDKLSVSLSDDDIYISDIKKTMSKNKRRAQSRTRSSKEEESLEKKVTQESVKELKRKSTRQKSVSKSIHSDQMDLSSGCSEVSTSTKIVKSRVSKRRRTKDKDLRIKKKAEDNNNTEDFISGSGVTLSSVDNWFKMNDPSSSKAEDTNVSMRDSLKHVLEKLDTTLIEMNQNTSNKFVTLFAAAQQQLSQLKEERERMYRQIATDLLSGVVKLIDQKFGELDKRSQDKGDNFMKELKEQASEVIREDWKQKRVMVQLLKEDVQAIVEHIGERAE